MKCLKLFVAAIAMVAMVACGGGSSASSVAVKQVECQYNCDIDGLLKLCNMTAEEKEQFKPMLDEKMVKSIEKELASVDGFKGAKAIEEVISEDGSEATVQVELTFGDGSTKIQKVEVENVDGKWMIPNPFANK
ncbi:MAG: DUF4878 domain-containing protein [Rikenellaceae bacterium]